MRSCRVRGFSFVFFTVILTHFSVFMRILEFYTGILFLTTNRVGALDEAIKSRITWISYYPPLNLSQTKEIWKTNIRRTERAFPGLEVDSRDILKFARKQYKKSIVSGMPKSNIWNGRKIQNAFKVATALAYWDACAEEEREQPQLQGSVQGSVRRTKLMSGHFKEYERSTTAFDDYVKGATGFDESERAFQMLERDDDWADGLDERDREHDVNGSMSLPVTSHEARRTPSMTQLRATYQGRSTSPIPGPPIHGRRSTVPFSTHLHVSSSKRSTVSEPIGTHQDLHVLDAKPGPGLRAAHEQRRTIDVGLKDLSHYTYADPTNVYSDNDHYGPIEGSSESSTSDEFS